MECVFAFGMNHHHRYDWYLNDVVVVVVVCVLFFCFRIHPWDFFRESL